MIIRNVSGHSIYFSWIGKYGKKLSANGTIEINDLYASDPKFRISLENGSIEVVSYDSNVASIATQGEIEGSESVDEVDEFFEYVYYGGFEATQTDIEIYESSGILKRIHAPNNGSLISCVIETSSPRVNGTLTGKPTIDGIKVSSELLTVDINNINTIYDKKYIAVDNILFLQGDDIGFMMTSDGSWDPTNTNIVIRIGVSYNPV